MKRTSEAEDAKWYGTEFVIAGRMVDRLTGIRIAVHCNYGYDYYDSAVSMKLWSIREYVVDTYRRVKFGRPAFRNHVR